MHSNYLGVVDCNHLKQMKIECNNTVDFVDGWSAEGLRRAVGEAGSIVMTAHSNADGDAVGSLTAMYAILSRVCQAKLTPMLPDGCPDDLLWLPYTDVILNGKKDLPETLSEIEVLLQRYCHENNLSNE